MPCVKIQTNIEIDSDRRDGLISEVCHRTAEKLGKPEKVTMVILEPRADIYFGGSIEPAVFVELKSIGLPEEKNDELSVFLCGLFNELLDISPERVYIEFSDVPGSMWGWNGKTFRRGIKPKK